MAAVTSTILALGGLGLSAGQAIKGSQQKKSANIAAKNAAASLKNLKETDMFSAIQSPDIVSRTQQAAAAQNAAALSVAKDMGAEGAAQVPGIVQANQETLLNASQAQAEQDFARDQFVAQGKQGVEARNVARKSDALQSELEGAQLAATEGQSMLSQGLSGAVASTGQGLSALGSAVPDYMMSAEGKNAWNAAKAAGLDKSQFADAWGVANGMGYSPAEMATIFNSGYDFSGSNDWAGIFSQK